MTGQLWACGFYYVSYEFLFCFADLPIICLSSQDVPETGVCLKDCIQAQVSRHPRIPSRADAALGNHKKIFF